jgi:hypothetical protein
MTKIIKYMSILWAIQKTMFHNDARLHFMGNGLIMTY